MRSTSPRSLLALTLVGLAGAACTPTAADGGPDIPGGGGGTEGEGEGEGGEGEGEAHPPEPTMSAARARAVGRTADVLRIDVSGVDMQDDTAGIQLKLLAQDGSEVRYFDSDFDGELDSGSSVVPFDAAAVVDDAHTYSAVVSLVDIPQVPTLLATVEVSVVDATGAVSAKQTLPVVLPPEVGAGAACDVAFVDNRCADGLGCKGTPTVCAEPEAPTISRLGYMLPLDENVSGPSLLVEGLDADQDVVRLHLEFMDSAGTPVMLDLDGDEVGDSSTFELTVNDVDGTAAFFVGHEMGLFLQDSVQQIAATPEDAGGRQGERVTTTIAPRAQRNPGQTCSAHGFDSCKTGSVCASPTATSTTTSCQPVATMRANACRDADVVEIAGPGSYSVVGVADGPSIWDVPAGCSPNDPKDRPEGVVQLRLASDAVRVTVTTEMPQTTFDTVVYVLSSCSVDGEAALVCADDGAQTVTSTLTMSGVAAGTYNVVVDSFSPAGGSFGLGITVE
ncbi:MAG TPA: hypothetical protein VGF99_14525 [Myxococcota bacterium]